MNKKEKALVILEELEEYISVDSAFEDFYIKGIIKGLTRIEEMEKKGE